MICPAKPEVGQRMPAHTLVGVYDGGYPKLARGLNVGSPTLECATRPFALRLLVAPFRPIRASSCCSQAHTGVLAGG